METVAIDINESLRSVENIVHSIIQSHNQNPILLNEVGFGIGEIRKVQGLVIERLRQWHYHQRAPGDGFSVFAHTLDDFQVWFDALAGLIWAMRSIVFTHYQSYCQLINEMLQLLFVSGFVVEEQPPQVLRMQTKWVHISIIFAEGTRLK